MRDIRNETGILSEVTRGVSGAARTLTFAYTTPLLVMGATAIQTASEFDAAMRNINSIAGLTEEQIASLSQQTLDFGKTTRSGAIESAGALYTVFSAGIMDVDDAFALMNTSVKTSEAGLSNLTTTTNALVSILLSYGDTSEAMAGRASDALTRMVQVGVGSMDAFASAIGGVMPSASAAGMSIEDLFGDMAFLTQRGLSAAQAGISLNAILKKLVVPTEAMQAAFHELGGSNLPELIDQFGSVNEVIEQLIANADGDMTQLFQMFNTTQGQRAIAQFSSNMDAWQQAQDDFNEGMEGATQRAWEEQMKSFAASWDLLKSAVQGAGIAIGQTMMPVLQPVVESFTELLNTFSSTNPELLSMIVGLVGVTAVLPPLVWLLTSLLSPIGLIVAGVGALGVAFATNFGGIRDIVVGTVGAVMGELEPLKTAFNDVWSAVFPEDLEQAITGDVQPVDLNPYDYIVVTEPKSLWQIYEEMGYADKFSWQEFMDAAFAGGWQGGAVTPDTPFTIAGDISPDVMRNIPAMNEKTDQPTLDNTPLVRSVQDALLGLIPATAETAGLVGGKIASLIFDGVVGGINYVFSGQAVSDAGNFFTTAKNWLSENVVTPFENGINEALEGTALGTALDGINTFITQISDTFDLEGDIDLSGFQSLADGIGSAFTSLKEADWSGVAKLGVIIGIIAGGVFGVALDVLNGIAAGLGAIIASFGSGLASLVDALAAAGNGDLEGAGVAIRHALIDIGIGLLQIPVGIIDAITGAIGNLLGVDVGSLGDWLADLKTELHTGLTELAKLETDPTNIIEAESLFNAWFAFEPGDTQHQVDNLVGLINENIGELKRDAFGRPEDLVITPDFQFTPAITADLNILDLAIGNESLEPKVRELATQIRDEFIAEMVLMGIVIPPDVYTFADGTIKPGWEAYATQAVITVSNPEIILTGTPTVPEIPMGEQPAQPMAFDFSGASMGLGAGVSVPDGTVVPLTGAISVQPLQDVDLTGVSFAYSEQMISGASAQEIIDTNFLPIELAWTTMFAAESPMAITFGEFSLGVTTGWQNMERAVTLFGLTTGVILPIATATFMVSTTLWNAYLMRFINQVTIAKNAVNELISVIGNLMDMQGTFSITVEVSGNINLGQPDGSHAGGLDRVPYDGYIAKLHEGERVLTAKEANMMDDADYSSAVVPRTMTNTNESNVTNNFYGMQNVDEIIFEMKRRGYNLGK